MVCVSSYPEDWERVAALALSFPGYVVPAFGLHPWYLEKAETGWETLLSEYLQRFPQALLGECGLDRLKNSAYEPQAEVLCPSDRVSRKIRSSADRACGTRRRLAGGILGKMPPKLSFIPFPARANSLIKL